MQTLPARSYRFLFGSAPFGGIVTYMQNLKDAIHTRRNLDCTWLFIEQHPKELISRIPPFSMNWTLKGGMVMRSRINALEKSGKHFDAAFFNHIVPMSFLGGFKRRVPLIISLDATPRLLNSYGKWYNRTSGSQPTRIDSWKHIHARKTYRQAAFLLPWSKWVRNSLIEHYGISEERIKVLPPGINLKNWTGKSASAEHQGTEEKKIKILFVGADFDRKGGELLVNVARRRELRNCEFHFVTRSFAGLAGNNIVVHDNLEPNSKDLIALYQETDIFALPTRADLSSVSAIEAMAMSLPVVITNVGGTDEIVRDNETGFVIPVDDENALADKLVQLVDDAKLRTSFGRKGRRLVEQNFNLENSARAIVDLMTEVSNETHH